MGKDWDKAVPSIDIWKETLRVLKPGAFAFIMSAPRQDVQSAMIQRIETAGFKVDFTPLYWTYASGFPKASNIGKMVDKRMGAEREVTGIDKTRSNEDNIPFVNRGEYDRFDKPTSPQAKVLDGSYAGFQPKPAVEIILVAMKPITEKTYVDQALKNGKGITWLDDCRIPYESLNDKPKIDRSSFKLDEEGNFDSNDYGKYKGGTEFEASEKGRFPANLLVSDDVLNDGNITEAKGGDIHAVARNDIFDTNIKPRIISRPCDSGSFSRYFDLDKWHINKLPNSIKKTFPFMIVPKASSGEKNEGCGRLENQRKASAEFRPNHMEKAKKGEDGNPYGRWQEVKNNHPTVKPIKLMSYLITLGSREKDLILDPFIGSGTTAIASRKLTRNFIGFELSKEYHKIAEARIKDELAQKKLMESLYQ